MIFLVNFILLVMIFEVVVIVCLVLAWLAARLRDWLTVGLIDDRRPSEAETYYTPLDTRWRRMADKTGRLYRTFRSADVLRTLVMVYVAIVSTAALAFSLMAVHDARVARAPADARLLQGPKVPGERPQVRPKEWWA